jgi:hypothetical protein
VNITQPEIRFRVFSSLLELTRARFAIQNRALEECDGFDLAEAVRELDASLLSLQSSLAVNDAFDEAEASKLMAMQARPLDQEALTASWATCKEYMSSQELLDYLDAAADVIGPILRPSRGLPGFRLQAGGMHLAVQINSHEQRSVRRPDMRYIVFTCLHELVGLKAAILRRNLCISDGAGLIETHEVMFSDMLIGAPHSVIGAVLFDKDEASALEATQSMPLDDRVFYSHWSTRKEHLLSRQMMDYLNAAEVAMWTMLGPGRGLPGWDPDAEFLA